MRADIWKGLQVEIQRHPRLQEQDQLKLVIQACFGPEHLLTDLNSSLQRLQEEKQQVYEKTALQQICNTYLRVPLSFMKYEELPLWNLLFCATANHSVQDLKDYTAICHEQFNHLTNQQLHAIAKQGIHHSHVYKQSYQPHYRLIKTAYVNYFPVFRLIWNMMKSKDHLVVAIDGRCTSGKSMLAGLLKEVFSCHVIPMDDFFLPPFKRTKSRLEQPGGNIDSERFYKSVIMPLLHNEHIQYQPYDCKTDTLLPLNDVDIRSCIILEGCYAHLPIFQVIPMTKVFLHVQPIIQSERLQHRSSALYDRFMKEWIPMEEQYFHYYQIPQHSDLFLDTSSFQL